MNTIAIPMGHFSFPHKRCASNEMALLTMWCSLMSNVKKNSNHSYRENIKLEMLKEKDKKSHTKAIAGLLCLLMNVAIAFIR
jgi:hypothetical protein